MEMTDVKAGDLITNGSSAGRVIECITKDARWGVPAVRIENIGLERFGGNQGMSSTVPDYLLRSGWRIVPQDWTPVIGGGLEERYVWASSWTHLQREVRALA